MNGTSNCIQEDYGKQAIKLWWLKITKVDRELVVAM